MLRVADETLEYLVLYRWSGNVRQLSNEIRRMAAMAAPGAVLMPAHLSPDIAASRRTVPADRPLHPNEVVMRIDQPLAAITEHVEPAAIQRAITACDGGLDEAAKMLGLSRKGLYLKRQRLPNRLMTCHFSSLRRQPDSVQPENNSELKSSVTIK